METKLIRSPNINGTSSKCTNKGDFYFIICYYHFIIVIIVLNTIAFQMNDSIQCKSGYALLKSYNQFRLCGHPCRSHMFSALDGYQSVYEEMQHRTMLLLPKCSVSLDVDPCCSSAVKVFIRETAQLSDSQQHEDGFIKLPYVSVWKRANL